MSYSITKRPTKKGIAYDLYYRWKGQRYRPLLGYDLNVDEAERLAIAMIGRIHRGERATVEGKEEAGGCPTFRTFLPTYWQTLKIHHRIDLRRPAIILNTHLLPRFGDRPLDSLTAEDGLSYIAARLDAGAAPGTVRKEWGVLMRILNLAVDFEKLKEIDSRGFTSRKRTNEHEWRRLRNSWLSRLSRIGKSGASWKSPSTLDCAKQRF